MNRAIAPHSILEPMIATVRFQIRFTIENLQRFSGECRVMRGEIVRPCDGLRDDKLKGLDQAFTPNGRRRFSPAGIRLIPAFRCGALLANLTAERCNEMRRFVEQK